MPGEDYQSWSTTAASNDAADTGINWREGQARASVNDSARSMMAAHAKNRNLQNGSITTTGLANQQNFASGVGYTTVPTNMRVLLHIGVGLTNTGPATLNMDGIGDVAIKTKNVTDLVGDELTGGGYAEFNYNGTNWILLNDAQVPGSVVIIPPVDADNDATIDFLGLNDAYDEYLIVITNLVADTGGSGVELWLQVTLDGGATWQTDAADYRWSQEVIFDGQNIWEGHQSSHSNAIKLTGPFVSNDPINPMGGEVRIYTPSLVAVNVVEWVLNFRDTLMFIDQYRGVGAYADTTSALTGIRFLMSAGNIKTGKFSIVGIKK